MAVGHSIGDLPAGQCGFFIPDPEELLSSCDHSFALEDDLGREDLVGIPEGLRDVGRLFAGGPNDNGDEGRGVSDGRAPLSSTGLTNLQGENSASSDRGAVGGLDHLEWSSYGFWFSSCFQDVVGRLRGAQKSAQEGNVKAEACEVEGETVVVSSSGARRGLYCPLVFGWQGVEIALQERVEESKSRYSVHVVARSAACMEFGIGVYARVKGFLERLGYNASRDVPSRIDLNVDLVNDEEGTVAEFIKAFVDGRIVRRSRSFDIHGKYGYESFNMGGSTVMVRIYDKFVETMKSGDALKRAVLIEKRWGGNPCPRSATRVEFQLRREVLKAMKFDEMGKLLGNLKTVGLWLTGKWLRFTGSVVDRNHTERFAVSPVWRRVTDALVVAFRSGDELPIEWRRVLRGDPAKLVKQAVGCLASTLAIVGRLPAEGAEAVRLCLALIAEHGDNLVRSVAEKRCVLDALNPTRAVGVPRVFEGPVFGGSVSFG